MRVENEWSLCRVDSTKSEDVLTLTPISLERSQVTNHLFKKVGAKYGMDLVSFNMQRGREFGIPGYMEFRFVLK